MFSFDKHLSVDEQINTCKAKGNMAETVSSLTSSLRAKQRIHIQEFHCPDEHKHDRTSVVCGKREANLFHSQEELSG